MNQDFQNQKKGSLLSLQTWKPLEYQTPKLHHSTVKLKSTGPPELYTSKSLKRKPQTQYPSFRKRRDRSPQCSLTLPLNL